MIKLVIEKPGYYIEFPGMKGVRTPAEIDITKINHQSVLATLKSLGIPKFKILYGVEDKPNSKPKFELEIHREDKSNKVEQNNNNIEVLLKSFIEDSNKRIDKLENIILDSNSNIEEKKTRKKLDNDVDSFIPSISVNTVSDIKNNSFSSTITEESEISESLDALNKIKKIK